MSESDAGEVDNWVFDSLVNFLHGSIWKAPVVGFIEDKSVVFDPDSYNNMTAEKEEEFRKIHDEYKAVVDFMLSSFMDDLQVTPEQVEEACRVREHHSKTLPESHITKVALEQLWAAEDFTAFRRLMTRKNIDLQLQSLELLVAKYGVLSPSLRSGDSEEPSGDDGEDDFLQVVIRYSDQLELFKCDYGTDGTCPGRNSCNLSSTTTAGTLEDDDESKNMKLHLSGIQFKNNVAPTPVKYQATLMSSSSSSVNNNAQEDLSQSLTQDNPESICPIEDVCSQSLTQDNPESEIDCPNEDVCLQSNSDNPESDCPNKDICSQGHSQDNPESDCPNKEDCTEVAVSQVEETDNNNISIAENEPCTEILPVNDSAVSEEIETAESELCTEISPVNDSAVSEEIETAESEPVPKTPSPTTSPCKSPTPTPPETSSVTEDNAENAQNESNPEPQPSVDLSADNMPGDGDKPEEEPESQLIQLEEAEAAMEEEAKLNFPDVEDVADEEPAGDDETAAEIEEQKVKSPKQTLSPPFDEKTAAAIAINAPEQRRLLTAVRKALEVNPEESEAVTSIDIPSGSSFENDEDLHKRREYLRAQRDKLVAMKRLEREKLLLANSSAGGSQSSRPKSARAAQIAIRNPLNMRAASIGSSEKSLSARRALADRLKQELIEKP